jgi:hypothetical protein
MRGVAAIFCSVALLAVAYGGFNLWRTAQQLNQVSATLAGRSSVRQPVPADERERLGIESADVDVSQRGVFEDAGFAEPLATEPEIAERYAESSLDEAYAELSLEEAYPEPPVDEAYAEAGFDEAYAEPGLDADYAEGEPEVEEIFDGTDPTVALQALLSDPDPEVREEAAALLEAYQSQSQGLAEDPQ